MHVYQSMQMHAKHLICASTHVKVMQLFAQKLVVIWCYDYKI